MTPLERIQALEIAVRELSSNNSVVQIGVIRQAFQAILDDMLERERAHELWKVAWARQQIDQQSNLAAGLPSDLTRAVVRRIES